MYSRKNHTTDINKVDTIKVINSSEPPKKWIV